MVPKGSVLYVYRCAECGHRGEQRLADDSHDGAESSCSVCGATVTLEWDGGVTIDSLIDIARRWREENGYVSRGGVIVLFKCEVQSWVNTLRNPEHWQPGCVAIDEDGKSWTAIAGNQGDGALMWLPDQPIGAL